MAAKRARSRRTSRGLVHVLTGPGRGKTTSALGLALRAYGAGASVAVVGFVKSPKAALKTGELAAARRLGDRFKIIPAGAGYVRLSGDTKKSFSCPRRHARAARGALELARKLAASGRVDVLVLDEVFCALAAGLLAREELEEFVRSRPDGVELVLTGRGAPAWMRRHADYWTDMRCVKHPFSRGQRARRGIEY